MTATVSRETLFGRWLILPVVILGSIAIVRALMLVVGEFINSVNAPQFLWPLIGIIALGGMVFFWFWFMRRREA